MTEAVLQDRDTLHLVHHQRNEISFLFKYLFFHNFEFAVVTHGMGMLIYQVPDKNPIPCDACGYSCKKIRKAFHPYTPPSICLFCFTLFIDSALLLQ